MDNLELIQKLDEMELLASLLIQCSNETTQGNQLLLDGLELLRAKILTEQTNIENTLIAKRSA